jgi:hypothetical protein
MRAILASVALVGCAYKPGSFSHLRRDFPGQRTTVGCIDLSVERRPGMSGGGAVLAYEFGNRCDRPATIDLARARVVARTFDGEDIELHPFDPNGEIRSLRIDGRLTGAEAIAYHAEAQLAEVCVDAASITETADPQWLCFASKVPPQLATSEHTTIESTAAMVDSQPATEVSP